MAEMGSAAAAPYLNPVHAVASVLMLRDHGRLDGLREARPAAAGFKFIGGREEGFPRRDININTAARILPVLPGKGSLRPGVLRDVIFLRRKLLFQLPVGRVKSGLVCKIAFRGQRVMAA